MFPLDDIIFSIYIPIWLDLLSNHSYSLITSIIKIYIPIWLDLLCKMTTYEKANLGLFTFQYG